MNLEHTEAVVQFSIASVETYLETIFIIMNILGFYKK